MWSMKKAIEAGSRVPKNNLKEQLALHSYKNKKVVTEGQVIKGSFSFKKVDCSTFSTPSKTYTNSGSHSLLGINGKNTVKPFQASFPVSSTTQSVSNSFQSDDSCDSQKQQKQSLAPLPNESPSLHGSSDNTMVRLDPLPVNDKVSSVSPKQLSPAPPPKPLLPVAFVTPVVSRTTNPRSTQSSCPSISRPSSDSLPSFEKNDISLQMNAPGSSLASCSFSSLPSLNSSATVLDIQSEIDAVCRERLSVMDDVCDMLSGFPSSEITALFKHCAGHVQKKLAMRRKLLLKEEDLRKLQHNTPSSSPSFSPLAEPPPRLSSFSSTSPLATTNTTSTSPLTISTSLLTNITSPSHLPHINDFRTSAMGEGMETCTDDDVDALMAMEAEEFEQNNKEIFLSLNDPDVINVDEISAPALSLQPITVPSITERPELSSGDSSYLSAKKPIFKPPFLKSGKSTQQDGSFVSQSSSLFKPFLENKAPRDDSSEFRGQYQHTREMYKIFNQVFGLKKFRLNQLEAVNSVMLGNDCFILMPTGGGKSLCYQLPALMLSGVTVVVSPLRSLIQDQVQKLTSLGIPAKHLSSDLTQTEENEVYASLSLRDPVTKLLYVTPEKLSASHKLVSTLQSLHNRQKLARFVIDEAHCISQWGHDFRPDYKKLSELRQKFPGIPTLALTATATPRVRTDILHQLNMHKTCKWFTQSFNRINLKYIVLPKKPKKVIQDIVELISKSFVAESGIVYCLSRRDCELMAGELCKGNIAALCYHAGLSNDERSMVQQRWLQEDRCKVVCATIAFGMGIDKPDVRFVIHHSIPKSMEGYYQEAGRAGRDAAPAQCILFYSYSDMLRLRRMVKIEKLRYDQEKVHMDNLFRMVQYCENETDCRRVQLLEYFAEGFDTSMCKNGSTPCDNCQSQVPFVSENVTELVRVIVESIQMVGRGQFTLNQYMDALKGSTSSKIANSMLSTLPLYNKGSGKTKHDLERLLHMLVMKDILSESIHIGSHDNTICYVQIGSKARDVLEGRITGIILKIKSRKGSTSATKYTPTASDTREEQLKVECYKALSMLRLSMASKHKMNNPEYVVSNASLQAMVRLLPTSKEELLGVEGYTAVRWSRFEGEEFLKITQEYSKEIGKVSKARISGAGTSYGGEVSSVYFQKKEQDRPVIGKGKRKKVGYVEYSSPLPKKQAICDSEDEFESPALPTQRKTPQLLAHPRK